MRACANLDVRRHNVEVEARVSADVSAFAVGKTGSGHGPDTGVEVWSGTLDGAV